jgi:hypothetical protein
VQGFILESDYEGDDGHPRIGNVQPGSISGNLDQDHLLKGDIVLEINGTPVSNHTQAAKIIKAESGDVVIKVRAEKKRETKPKAGLFNKSKSKGVDKQARLRGASSTAPDALPLPAAPCASRAHPACPYPCLLPLPV